MLVDVRRPTTGPGEARLGLGGRSGRIRLLLGLGLLRGRSRRGNLQAGIDLPGRPVEDSRRRRSGSAPSGRRGRLRRVVSGFMRRVRRRRRACSAPRLEAQNSKRQVLRRFAELYPNLLHGTSLEGHEVADIHHPAAEDPLLVVVPPRAATYPTAIQRLSTHGDKPQCAQKVPGVLDRPLGHQVSGMRLVGRRSAAADRDPPARNPGRAPPSCSQRLNQRHERPPGDVRTIPLSKGRPARSWRAPAGDRREAVLGPRLFDSVAESRGVLRAWCRLMTPLRYPSKTTGPSEAAEPALDADLRPAFQQEPEEIVSTETQEVRGVGHGWERLVSQELDRDGTAVGAEVERHGLGIL